MAARSPQTADDTTDRTRRTSTGGIDGRTTRGSRSVGLKEIVTRRILDAILKGTLQPGQLIKTAELAEQYGVSRTPVREALASLELEGLVTVIPHRGYLVRQVTLQEARDIFFMRTVIEGAAAERAATRLTGGELDALASLRPPRQPDGEPYSIAFDEHFNEFHRRIAAAAGSQRLASTLDGLLHDVRRLQSVGMNAPSPEQIQREHLEILSALKERDGDRARATMESHIRSLYTTTLQAPLD